MLIAADALFAEAKCGEVTVHLTLSRFSILSVRQRIPWLIALLPSPLADNSRSFDVLKRGEI
jgi:hypothetical protein